MTICTQYRICRLGNITDGGMKLSECGKMIDEWFPELPDKFGNIQLGEMVIMPNHIHMIIFIIETGEYMDSQETGGHIGQPLHRPMCKTWRYGTM